MPSVPRFLIGLLFALTLARGAVAQTGSVVTVDTNNVLSINGQKKFVIGFSTGPPNNSLTPDGRDALQELRDAGGLLFRITQTNNWNSQLIASQQAALDWAEQHGMFCWVYLAELSEFAVTNTTTAASLRNIVDTFRNHPALGLWKNYDEAWWGGISVSNLLDGYNVIKQEDTNHPVVQTHAPRGTVTNLQPYNVAADLLALDIYPVVASGLTTNPPITNGQISQVGDWTDVLGQVAEGQKEYWIIEQIAFSGTTPPSHTLVFPTYQQSRYMAYQAINDGARGLMFFGGNIAATLTARDAALGWNWTFWTNVLKPIVEQLGDKGLLAQALVAPNSTLPVTFTGTTAPDIEFCVREVSPYLYILASKRETTTVNVTFGGLPSWAGTGEVLFESPRTVQATNGQFTDQFAPFDVHVYRFAESNVPPSILTAPQNEAVQAGATASFWVAADGTGPITYQWLKNGISLADGGNISGSTLSQLNVSGVSASDVASYSVRVSGSGTVTSAAASLTIITNEAPQIISQPLSLTNNAGATAVFTVNASGPGTLLYQWTKNSTNLSDGGNVFGSQTSTLTLTGISSGDAGNYSVTVSNSFGGQTSSPATLTVVYPNAYYDSFSYPIGASLNGQTNDSFLVWADVGTATSGPEIIVQAGSLNIPGLKPPLGNCIFFGGQGKSGRLSFPSNVIISSGMLYYSFAFEVLNTNGLSPSGVFIAGFNNTTGTQTNQPSVVGTRLYVRATNAGFNLGVAKNSSISSDWVWDPRTFQTNQVLFIAGSYTFNQATGSDDVSQMWINPASSNFNAAAPPAGPLVAASGSDLTGSGIESFVFFQRLTNEPPAMLADELRIGPTWASVTTVPPPAIIFLTNATRLPGGSFQFGYTNGSATNGSIYASTNLVNWTSIGQASEISPGQYQFTDPATNLPRRFYQLRAP